MFAHPYRWAKRIMSLGLIGAAATCWPVQGASGPAVEHPAPALTLHTLDGQDFTVKGLRGKVVILAFWATWCAPCREELNALSAYAAAHSSDGLQVLGISLDEPEQLAEVKKIAATLSFPVGLLGSAWAGGYGRIWRLPANFTIDRTGILIDNSWNDAQPEWTPQRLEKIVSPLLVQRGGSGAMVEHRDLDKRNEPR